MRTLTPREIAAGRIYLPRPVPITLGPGVWFLGGARGVGTSTELLRQCIAYQRSAEVWHVTPSAADAPGAVLASITRALQTEALRRKLAVPRFTGAQRYDDALAELALLVGALVRPGAWIGIDLQALPPSPELVTQIARGLFLALPPLGGAVAVPPGIPLPILPNVHVVDPVPSEPWARSLVERQTGQRLQIEVADVLYRSAGGIPGDLLLLAERMLTLARAKGRPKKPTLVDANRAVAEVTGEIAQQMTPRDRGAIALGLGAPWGADVWPSVRRGWWLPGRGPTPLASLALTLPVRDD